MRAQLYRQMLLVRWFEERVLALFAAGEVFGTTHTYIGQEANAVAVLNHLNAADVIVSNHRCHGHYLVRTGDTVGLLAELMGRAGGVCGGRGGSQHLCRDSFYTSGVQGNMVPVAAGMAYAEKRHGSGAVVTLFIGDGTLGQGVVYETFNLASLWNLPLLVVVENNGYAQTTPVAKHLAGDFALRATAFGISVGEIDTTDAERLYAHFDPIVRWVRDIGRPHVEIIHTHRMAAHSKGDDYRSEREIREARDHDPVALLAGRLNPDERAVIEAEVTVVLARAEAEARAMPFPRLDPD